MSTPGTPRYEAVRERALSVVNGLVPDDGALRTDLEQRLQIYGDGQGGGRGVEEATLRWWLDTEGADGPTSEDLRVFKIGLVMGTWAASEQAELAHTQTSLPLSALGSLGMG